MSDTFTNNLNLTKPAVGGSTDTWGTKINNDLDSVDAIFSATGTEVNIRFNSANFDDNKKALFGTGDDLEIYHDGSNSIIKDSGTGNLTLLATNLSIKNAGDSENYLTANDGGDLILYKAGTEKARTSTNGFNVTGDIAVTGTVDGRDIATDGTKLDGIAAGATNVTNTNQLTNGAGFLTSADGGNAAQVDGFDASTGGGNSKLVATESFGYMHLDNWMRLANDTGIFINETSARHFYAKSGSVYWHSRSSDTTVSGFRLENSGGTQIGWIYVDANSAQGFLTTSGGWAIRTDNSGNFTATGNVTAYSDERLKSNIKDIDSALNKVCSLRGVEYTRNATGKKEIGVIAQEVKEVVPELVDIVDESTEESEGLKDLHIMKYQNTVGLLIEAIKELEKKVSDLEGK